MKSLDTDYHRKRKSACLVKNHNQTGSDELSKVHCFLCRNQLDKSSFDLDDNGRVMFTFCKSCSDNHRINKSPVECSSCSELKGPEYYEHYRKRFKKDGMRIRVGRICIDCKEKENSE